MRILQYYSILKNKTAEPLPAVKILENHAIAETIPETIEIFSAIVLPAATNTR